MRNPRHVLDVDVNDSLSPQPIPSIAIRIDPDTEYNYVLIVPSTMSLIAEQLPNSSAVGSIEITYPELYKDIKETESLAEYDEDEQLYAAMQSENIKNKYPTSTIPINLTNNGVLSIVVPHIKNTIAYNIFANELVKHLNLNKEWILLAPSNLNNGQTVNKLQLHNDNTDPVFQNVPVLQPPHTITGVSAALLSLLSLVDAPIATALVLDSEGQIGYEKSDNDAIVDVASILGIVFNLDHKNYVRKVSSNVRKFNGYSNLGMYI